MNALLCHEAAEVLLPRDFDESNVSMLVASGGSGSGGGRRGQQRACCGGGGPLKRQGREMLRWLGAAEPEGLDCDEEIGHDEDDEKEEEDVVSNNGSSSSGSDDGSSSGYMSMATEAPIPVAGVAAPHQVSGPPMMPLPQPACLPGARPAAGTGPMPPTLPPPPKALGRSQSLPAYHTSVVYPPQQPQPQQRQQQQLQQQQAAQAATAAAPPVPPPPPLLIRQRSFSSLSRPYRASAGRFLSENLARVEEAAAADDIAERLVTMHAQERDFYAPPLAYFHRLETDPLLAQWRRGAVRWFSKVVEHLHANREAIATATNFLDRYFGALLYPQPSSSARTGAGSSSTNSSSSSTNNSINAAAEAIAAFRPPPLLLEGDRQAFEQAAVCALVLGLKMHQGDSTASIAQRLAALTSAPPTPRALCEMEFRMMGALGRYLNPPTAGILIHHLLHFIPRAGVAASAAAGEDGGQAKEQQQQAAAAAAAAADRRVLVLALDDHANDLALMALETPRLVTFPVSVVAVAAILASFARLRADGARLDPSLELRWLQALDANDLKVEPDEINDCLELLGRQAKRAAALSYGPGAAQSPFAGVTGLYLPHYLEPPRVDSSSSSSSSSSNGKQQQAAVPATPGPASAKLARALSPTGVDEIDMLQDAAATAAAAPPVAATAVAIEVDEDEDDEGQQQQQQQRPTSMQGIVC